MNERPKKYDDIDKLVKCISGGKTNNNKKKTTSEEEKKLSKKTEAKDKWKIYGNAYKNEMRRSMQ